MVESIQIRAASEADAPAWDAYVLAHPRGTFFHRYGWKRLIESTYRYPGHYLLAESDGELRGVLPLGEVKHLLFGHSLISVPFCVYGGVLADDDGVREALELRAMHLAEDLGVDHLEMRNEQPVRDDWLRKDGLYVTFKKAISEDHEANLSAIPRKQRAMVRKGIKAGLVGELDDGIEHLYEAYSQSVRNLGTPVFPKAHFQAIRDEFGDDVDVLTVRHEGTVVASVMNYYFRDQVLPFYGGGISRRAQPGGQRFHVLGGHAARGRARLPGVRFRPQQGRYRFLQFQEALGIRTRAAELRVSPGECGRDAGSEPEQSQVPPVHQRLEETAGRGQPDDRSVAGERPGLNWPAMPLRRW